MQIECNSENYHSLYLTLVFRYNLFFLENISSLLSDNITEYILHNYLNDFIFPYDTFTLILSITTLSTHCLVSKLSKVYSDLYRTKNRRAIQFVPLEIEINRHIENINILVMDLKSMNIFLEYNWLVKHSLEVYWDKEKIWFIRYPKKCKI